MAEEFSRSILVKVVAQICQMVGFESIMTTPLEVLADILKRFILKLGRMSLQYGEHCGSSVISLMDLSHAFHDCGILPSELSEFLTLLSPLPKCITVPKFPVTVNNSNQLHDSPDVDDLIQTENTQPGSEEDLNDQREALKIKISFIKIKEACEAKKSKHKNKRKKKKKRSKNND